MARKKKEETPPDLNSMAGKYFIAKQKGLNKSEAAKVAGYKNPATNTCGIERTKQYQAIEKYYYKDALLAKITLDQIAEEKIKIIFQDRDLGAKNRAIEDTVDRIEDRKKGDDSEKVMVILKG